MTSEKIVRKPKSTFFNSLFILTLAGGLGIFAFGYYIEQQELAQKESQRRSYIENKMKALLPQINDLHHQRIQYAIDNYPNLKENPQIQKFLMSQMAVDIVTMNDAMTILKNPYENTLKEMNFENFPKENQWTEMVLFISMAATNAEKKEK